MNKFVLATALIAGTVMSTSAFAATQTKVGEVKSIDTVKSEVVLSGGETFEAAKTIKLETLKIGEKVKITYDMKDGKMMASHIKPEK